MGENHRSHEGHAEERSGISGVWNLRGTDNQNRIVQAAIDNCDFPFEELKPSLAKEGKQTISVTWEDLSRYSSMLEDSYDESHDHHMHGEDGHEVSAVERTVDGRRRVLGLFYLPPYTRVVIDSSLVNNERLAQEVFLAEGAHAVDYHYMNNDMRVAVWNALHSDSGDIAEGTFVPESGDIAHGHSWFDGPAGYSTWVGEGFMGAFIEAFAPKVGVSINLQHRVMPGGVKQIRDSFLGVEDVVEPTPEPTPPPTPEPTPEPTPTPEPDEGLTSEQINQNLEDALIKILDNKNVPKYLTKAGNDWLNERSSS